MCFRGEKFLQLPYVVKGMDVSFSGILSHLEESIGSAFLEEGVRILNVALSHWTACVWHVSSTYCLVIEWCNDVLLLTLYILDRRHISDE